MPHLCILSQYSEHDFYERNKVERGLKEVENVHDKKKRIVGGRKRVRTLNTTISSETPAKMEWKGTEGPQLASRTMTLLLSSSTAQSVLTGFHSVQSQHASHALRRPPLQTYIKHQLPALMQMCRGVPVEVRTLLTFVRPAVEGLSATEAKKNPLHCLQSLCYRAALQGNNGDKSCLCGKLLPKLTALLEDINTEQW